MVIQTEETPNPNALKFLLGKSILDNHQTLDFYNAYIAEKSPLASALFELEGVLRVFVGQDFLVVTKTEAQSWDFLKSKLLSVIMDFMLTGQPLFSEQENISLPEMEIDSEDIEIVKKIKEVLATHVRPSVASDGGDIVFCGYKNGSVYLKMMGSCQGCPSSSATLKHGVERILQHYIPEVLSVEKVAI
ncbi:MAG: NifU family protein [Commensalibacter sp.]